MTRIFLAFLAMLKQYIATDSRYKNCRTIHIRFLSKHTFFGNLLVNNHQL